MPVMLYHDDDVYSSSTIISDCLPALMLRFTPLRCYLPAYRYAAARSPSQEYFCGRGQAGSSACTYDGSGYGDCVVLPTRYVERGVSDGLPGVRAACGG